MWCWIKLSYRLKPCRKVTHIRQPCISPLIKDEECNYRGEKRCSDCNDFSFLWWFHSNEQTGKHKATSIFGDNVAKLLCSCIKVSTQNIVSQVPYIKMLQKHTKDDFQKINSLELTRPFNIHTHTHTELNLELTLLLQQRDANPHKRPREAIVFLE